MMSIDSTDKIKIHSKKNFKILHTYNSFITPRQRFFQNTKPNSQNTTTTTTPFLLNTTLQPSSHRFNKFNRSIPPMEAFLLLHKETTNNTVNHHHPHSPNPSPYTLYTALSKSKNDMCIMLNIKQPLTPIHSTKSKVIKCFKQNPPLNAFLSREMSTKVLSNSNHQQIPFLSEHNNISSSSEKDRFHRFYSSLYKLQSYITSNPSHAKQIIKDFLMSHHIYNPKYYVDDRINNFLAFITSERIVINPHKLFKQILKEALVYGKLYNDINYKHLMLQPRMVNKEKKVVKKKKEKTGVDVVEKRKKVDLERDMELQRMLYDKKCQMKHQIDLHKRPRLVIELLEGEFEKGKDKNRKRNCVRDYNVLKKENKITDFVCFVKARNNYNVEKLIGDFFLKKGKKGGNGNKTMREDNQI